MTVKLNVRASPSAQKLPSHWGRRCTGSERSCETLTVPLVRRDGMEFVKDLGSRLGQHFFLTDAAKVPARTHRNFLRATAEYTDLREAPPTLRLSSEQEAERREHCD